MKILVTGAAGFIGSNYVRYVLSNDDDTQIVVADALTYAGNLENLAGLEKDTHLTFVKSDIGSSSDMNAIFEDHSFDCVVNFAAESHVDRSLTNAAGFIQTNIVGVQMLLDACREHDVTRFLQVSTDEVYGSLGPEGSFSELSPIQPNNPYAATKASADFLVRAAQKTHGLDTVITRCSNNYGPYQFPEKLIPLMIANALEDKELPVYGDGMQVRDWIYVADHCSAIDVVLRKGKTGEIYNIGGNHDIPNLDVVRVILDKLGKPESLIRHITDRPGHDRRYAMDSTKLQDTLGWAPVHSFEQGMATTIEWYLDNKDWSERIRSGDYVRYYEEMYASRLAQGSDT